MRCWLKRKFQKGKHRLVSSNVYMFTLIEFFDGEERFVNYLIDSFLRYF